MARSEEAMAVQPDSARSPLRRLFGPIRQVVLAASLTFAVLPGPTWGAEVFGRITLPSGQPAANEPILRGGTPIGKTDVAGVFWLNLPPGPQTLTVKGQQINIAVSPSGTRLNIQLK